METYIRSEQTESFPQGGEIQNGDTGNHQDIPPTGGVGHLNRFQRRLLPHTNTGTVQEISEISCTRSDIPVQSLAFWPVYSTLGVHCSGKGGETNGHTQGYKDPPIPRRVVGESQIPPGLSSAYSGSCENMPRTRLAGEFGKVRAGAKVDLQFCRLPVQPQIRSDSTHLDRWQNLQDKISEILSLTGLAVHVPDRFANTHREAISARPTTHETHTVASQKQLEGTQITRKGNPDSQVTAPPLTMVATRRQHSYRSTITPNKTCSDASKERWGTHLNECTARGSWSLPESKLHINYLELKAVFLTLKEFPDLCNNKIVLVATDNTTVVSYINKEGGMKSGPLCALLWRILTWCTRHQVTLKARHILGRLNMVADKLFHSCQTIQTEWSLLQEVFQAICTRWHLPQTDLFATRFNKLPQFVSPVPDPRAVAVDALFPMGGSGRICLSTSSYLGQSGGEAAGLPMQKNHSDSGVAQHALVLGSSDHVQSDPTEPVQPVNTGIQIPHRNLTNLNLHAWLLEPQQSRNKASLRQWQHELRLLKEDQPDQSMRQSGPFLQSGASLIRWTSGHPL